MGNNHKRLGKILKAHGVGDVKSFEAVMAAGGFPPDVLPVVDAEVLGEPGTLDHLVYEDAVLDSREVRFSRPGTLTVRNCVIRGSLVISGREDSFSRIELNHVIVLGQILIHSQKNLDIVLDNVNAYYLTVAKCDLETLTVTSSNISHFTLEFSRVERLVCTLNTFLFYTYYENQTAAVTFDFEQLNPRLLLTPDKHRTALIKANNLFSFIDNHPPYFSRTSFDGNLLLKTYDFLQQYSKINSSKSFACRYRYAATVHLQENAFMRAFMIAVGGFIQPWRIALIGVVAIFLYSLFYATPLATFTYSTPGEPMSSLRFTEALYFSGVAFTTLGFGDISPLGFTRLVAVLEGVTGVVTTSAFVISFVRKYVDM